MCTTFLFNVFTKTELSQLFFSDQIQFWCDMRIRDMRIRDRTFTAPSFWKESSKFYAGVTVR